MSKSGIHIKPSKKGTFTAAAKKHGKGVQEFARQVMANKENYSPAMVKKANFARNAAKWKHESGGGVDAGYQELGGVHSMRPLPGHQVPVGKAFTPTPGHQYPFYERDMQPLPQKAMYGADIEPFVYHGYSDNTPLGDGIRSNYQAPKKKLSAKAGANMNKFTAANARKWKHQDGGEVPQDQKVASFIGGMFSMPGKRMEEAQEILKQAAPLLLREGGYIPMAQGGLSAPPELQMLPLPKMQRIYNEPGIDEAPVQVQQPAPYLTPGEMAKQKGLAPNPMDYRDDTQNQLQQTYDTNKAARKKFDKGLDKINKPKSNIDYQQLGGNMFSAGLGLASLLASKKQPTRHYYYTPEDTPYYNPYPMGTGSQAIYAQGGFVDSNAVDFPYKSGITFQAGGRAPIYTSDEKDPRLKAYQDSLNLYHKGLKPFLDFGDYGDGGSNNKTDYKPSKSWGITKVKKADIIRDIDEIKSELDWQENKKQRKNLKDRLALLNESLKTGVYPTNMIYPQTSSGALIYKKPVQPVILEERPIKSKQLSVDKNQFKKEPFSIDAEVPVGKSLQQPTTNYSVTFRDETSPSKQRTQYFPNLESWRDFTNNAGYLSREESGGGQSASAVGYSQFKHGGEIMNVASPEFPIARMGGQMRRNYDMSEYEQGGELELYDDRTGAQPISENPASGPIVEFKGPSHEERNGIGSKGIPMAWQGNEVEVEGGETAFEDNQGNFQILGNMKNPLTGRKFKQDGKLIAKAERKADNKMKKGLDLVNEADPDNPYEMLKFNTGKAKMQGAMQKFKEMDELRHTLADIQQQKLDLAASLGIEPMEMDKKAYFGKMMTAQGGIGMPFEMDVKGMPIENYAAQVVRPQGTLQNGPEFFQPANYFSNPAWATYPRQNVATSSAVAPITLPTVELTGSKPSKTGATRTGGDRPPTRGGNERPLRPSMPKPVDIPYSRGSVTADIPYTPTQITPPSGETPPDIVNPPVTGQTFGFDVPPTVDLTSDAEGFNWMNAYPEIYAMATNQVEPVLMQKYRPELLQPYQVTFQDQLNRNTDTFRAMAQASGWNPSAMGALAAQRYAADQGVLGNEFRTNQELSANVANANRQIMNETQKLNLGLADQQYVRQTQAKANTRQRAFDALQSLSTKQLQHQKAMNELKTMENLYNYRFNKDYQAKYEGPKAIFNDPLVAGVDKDGNPIYKTDLLPASATKAKTKTKGKYGINIAREFKNYK